MRPAVYPDVVAAARVLRSLPEPQWPDRMDALFSEADLASAHVAMQGQPHPVLGDGSLMCVALRSVGLPKWTLDDPGYCRAMAFVYNALATRQPD